VLKAYKTFTDDYGAAARVVRDYCQVLLASTIVNFESRSESDLNTTPENILGALADCAEIAVARGESESTIDLLRVLYVSVGRFIPEADAKLVTDRNAILLECDVTKEPFSNADKVEELCEQMVNEAQRLDEEFDQLLADIETQNSNAEIALLQKQIHKVEAEFEGDLGLAAWENGNLESALRSYTKALSKDSDSAVLLLNRGNLQLEMGLFEDGIADLEKARRLDPSLPSGNADLFRHLSPELREAVRQSMLKHKSSQSAKDE
jgi:tetratricopeptide (TPR) repeat protein